MVKLDCDIKYAVVLNHYGANISEFIKSFCTSGGIKFIWPSIPVYIVKKCYVLDNPEESKFLVVPEDRYNNWFLHTDDDVYSKLLDDLKEYNESEDGYFDLIKPVQMVSSVYDEFNLAIKERNILNEEIKSNLEEWCRNNFHQIVGENYYTSILFSEDRGILEWRKEVDAGIEKEQLEQCKIDYDKVFERENKDDNRDNTYCSHAEETYSEWYLKPFEEESGSFYGIRQYNNAVERYCHECGCVERIRGEYVMRYLEPNKTTALRDEQRKRKLYDKKSKHSFY